MKNIKNVQFVIFYSVDNIITSIRLCFDITNRLIAEWDLNILKIMKEELIIDIPFFKPDFSNYPKLMNKLKTYVNFS